MADHRSNTPVEARLLMDLELHRHKIKNSKLCQLLSMLQALRWGLQPVVLVGVAARRQFVCSCRSEECAILNLSSSF
jgi:hypothetical protein